MIKKIIVLLLVIFSLCSCSEQRISEILFIASIGFEASDEGYKGYFYLPVSEDIGNANEVSSNGSGEYMVLEGNDIVDIFQKSQASTELQMNLRHVSSLVINKNLLESGFLDSLIEYVKHSDYLDFNFYIFVTNDKLEDIYGFQNPNKESVLNSILVSTFDSPFLFLAQEPVHFLEFCREYLLDKSIRLPLITVEELWKIEDEMVKSYKCRDSVIYYLDNSISIIDNSGSPYMKDNQEFYDKINEENIFFRDYKIEVKYKDNIKIKVSCKYTPLVSLPQANKDIINASIEERIRAYLSEFSEIDPLNLAYYSKIYSKSYEYSNIEYEVKSELY